MQSDMNSSQSVSAQFSPTRTERHDPISASAFYTTNGTEQTESASPMDVDESPTLIEDTTTTTETTSADPELLEQPDDENDSDIEMKDADRATSDVDDSKDEAAKFPFRKWDLEGRKVVDLEDVPSGPSIPAEFRQYPRVHPNAPPQDAWPRNEAGIVEKFRCEHTSGPERSFGYRDVIDKGFFCCREPLEGGESIVVIDEEWVVQVWGVVCSPGTPVRVRVRGLDTRFGQVPVSVPGVIAYFNEYVNVRFWFNLKCYEHRFFHDDPRLELTNAHKKRILDNLYEQPVPGKTVEYFDVGTQNMSYFSATQTSLDDHFSKLCDLDLANVICGAEEVLPKIDQATFSQEEYERACRRVFCSQCRRIFSGIDDMTFHEHPLECFRKAGRMVCKSCIDWWSFGCSSSGALNCNTHKYDSLCRACGTSDTLGVVSCEDCQYGFCVGCMVVHMNEDRFSEWLEKPGNWKTKGWRCFGCDPEQIAANQNWYKRSRLPDFCGSIELSNQEEKEFGVFHANMIDAHILFNKAGELWRDNFNALSMTERSTYNNEVVKMIVSSLFVGYEGRKNPETGGAMQYLIGCLHNAKKLFEHHHQEFSETQRPSERPFLKEWIWRIYVDAFAKNDALVNIVLQSLHLHPFIELVEYNFPQFRRRDSETYDEHEGLFGTFIRFHALAEPFLRIAGSCVAIRDIDNLYTHIDFGKLEDWLANGQKNEKPFHRYYCQHYGNPFWYGDKETIDARIKGKELTPQHYGGYPLLAGLFASQVQIPQIMEDIFEYCVRLWRYPSLHPDHIRSADVEEEGGKVTPFLYACDQFFLDDCIFQEMCARKAEYFETVRICVDRTIASDECRGADRKTKNKSYLSIPRSRHTRENCGAKHCKLSRVLKLLNISNDQRAHEFFTHFYQKEVGNPHMAGENLDGMVHEMRRRYGSDDEKKDGGGVFELYGRYDGDLSRDFEKRNLCEGVDPRGLDDAVKKELKKGLNQKAKGWELNDCRCEVLQMCLELDIEKSVSVALFQRISWLTDEQLLEIVTRVKNQFAPETEEE